MPWITTTLSPAVLCRIAGGNRKTWDLKKLSSFQQFRLPAPSFSPPSSRPTGPAERLLRLVAALSAGSIPAIVLVDDGSGPRYADTFRRAAEYPRVRLVRHAVNLGKGAALKSGFNEALCTFPHLQGVITADADGQHHPEDILQVADRLAAQPDRLVLGTRAFHGDIPLRSRIGNRITRGVMHALVGRRISGGQTGLCGIPAALLPHLLRMETNGCDFEMDMLIAVRKHAILIDELPIRTNYEQGDRQRRFNPLSSVARAILAAAAISMPTVVFYGFASAHWHYALLFAVASSIMLRLAFPAGLAFVARGGMPARSHRTAENASRTWAYAAGLALLAWFVFLVRGGLASWFDADDLMNLNYYWTRSWPQLLRANLFFWSSYYRPGGGLFYRSMYALWGFHPLPFRIAVMVLLCVNLVLLAVVVRQLTESRWAMLVALLVVGIHPYFSGAYFTTGTVYDVLAYTFVWGAFALYVGVRRAERLPGWGTLAVLLCLLAAALNSKEISVVLPVAVALYELVWRPPRHWNPAAVWRWIRREGRFAAMGAVFDLAFIIGKRYGPNSLWDIGPYRPHYTVAGYLQSLWGQLSGLMHVLAPLLPWQIAALLIVMAAIAAVSRRRSLVWGMAFILVGILPLAFIPTRAGFAHLVPSVGWAVYCAGLLDWLLNSVTGHRSSLRGALQVILLILLFIELAPWQRKWIEMNEHAAHEMLQERFERYNQEIRALIPRPRKGARILLLSDADGHDDWDVYFLIRLTYGDPAIEPARMKDLGDHHLQADLTKFDYVLDWKEGHFVLVSRFHGITVASTSVSRTGRSVPSA